MALELDRCIARLGERGFELAAVEHNQRVGVQIVNKIAVGARFRNREQVVVETDFRRHRVSGGNPVDRAPHLAAVGRVAAPGCRIVGAAEQNRLPVLVLFDPGTGHEIGVPQPHLAARSEPMEFFAADLP